VTETIDDLEKGEFACSNCALEYGSVEESNRVEVDNDSVKLSDLRNLLIESVKKCKEAVTYQDTNERDNLVEFQVVCGTKIKYNMSWVDDRTHEMIRCKGCERLMRLGKITQKDIDEYKEVKGC